MATWQVFSDAACRNRVPMHQYTLSGAITTGQWVTMYGSTNVVAVTGDNATNIAGLAQNAGSGTGTQTVVDVIIPDPNIVFKGTATSTPNATDVGAQFGINASLELDLTNTTQKVFTLVDYSGTTVYATVINDIVGPVGGSGAA